MQALRHYELEPYVINKEDIERADAGGFGNIRGDDTLFDHRMLFYCTQFHKVPMQLLAEFIEPMLGEYERLLSLDAMPSEQQLRVDAHFLRNEIEIWLSDVYEHGRPDNWLPVSHDDAVEWAYDRVASVSNNIINIVSTVSEFEPSYLSDPAPRGEESACAVAALCIVVPGFHYIVSSDSESEAAKALRLVMDAWPDNTVVELDNDNHIKHYSNPCMRSRLSFDL